MIVSSESTAPKCFQCGSPLIQLSNVTSQPDGSLFPQTVLKYRCSNDDCQEEKDKEEAKRIKLRDEKMAVDKVREEKRLADKQQRIQEKLAAASIDTEEVTS